MSFHLVHINRYCLRICSRQTYAWRWFRTGGESCVGIIGGVLGGWLFGLVGITAGGIIGSLITSVVGAVVLLWIVGI